MVRPAQKAAAFGMEGYPVLRFGGFDGINSNIKAISRHTQSSALCFKADQGTLDVDQRLLTRQDREYPISPDSRECSCGISQ